MKKRDKFNTMETRMVKLLAELILNAIALILASRLIPGIAVTDFTSAFLAAVVIALINTFLKPVLVILTFPVTLLTLGLFRLVLNALLFALASSFVSGFAVSGFWAALLGSIVYSLLASLLHGLVK